MTTPPRSHGRGTFFVTASCWEKKKLLQSDRSARLFIETLFGYRSQGKFLLHEFVVMTDHFHLLITPFVTLERAVQLIKGGFSFRAGKQFGWPGEIWQESYYDRRVRDAAEFARCKEYIHRNPVKRGLAALPNEYPFGSASGIFELDEVPQGLKPSAMGASMRR